MVTLNSLWGTAGDGISGNYAKKLFRREEEIFGPKLSGTATCWPADVAGGCNGSLACLESASSAGHFWSHVNGGTSAFRCRNALRMTADGADLHKLSVCF